MLDHTSKVLKFHRLFNAPALVEPTIPSEDRCKLRVSLIAEELKELEEAIANKDIVEVADALTDIKYVLAGTFLEFGLADFEDALFNEVQRSNMSKACKNLQEAVDTVEHYESQGVPCYWEKKEMQLVDMNNPNAEPIKTVDFFIVYRKEDKKVLKSIYYSPADLKSILPNV